MWDVIITTQHSSRSLPALQWKGLDDVIHGRESKHKSNSIIPPWRTYDNDGDDDDDDNGNDNDNNDNNDNDNDNNFITSEDSDNNERVDHG